ncbi:MAG: type I pullulanase [Prevotellaceae bacterium]|nr:type I pullulanase [Prevotellaceae bacterium]
MKLNDYLLVGVAATTVASCTPSKKEYASYELYPVRQGPLVEMEYTPAATKFTLWSPVADEVRLMLYEAGNGGHAYKTVPMKPGEEGTWTVGVDENLIGKFYTFNVKIDGKWLGDTPGINAKAVGVNGKRAAIIDMAATNPEGWAEDRRPPLASPADIILYELHHRDFSIDASSGIEHRGKFLALTETGTVNPDGLSTGIDHLKELGVTHVHLLPSYDYASVDETRLDENNYNWGYDPQNYNVPDGSYATNPYLPETRIREFKQMVQALHKAGIRVVMDVVYNHTYNAAESNFERTVPGYFYRRNPDGSYADASACGNETASERPMMRKFMVESVCWWINEYHVDGFRFDLMGIHDIETMNEIRRAASAIDPTIFIYGEGWSVSDPQLPLEARAVKENMRLMPGIAAFSDELRDGLRGPFNDDSQGAFLAGIPGAEESVKFGIVGGVAHPQVDNDSVNLSHAPWADEPVQLINYVSCHDDLCLVDRLNATMPGIGTETLVKLDKLAQTAVLTSQGIPFIYAGEEVLRDKKGVRNSYNSPDGVNAIDWTRKSSHGDLFAYYQGLIALRGHHPAFHIGDAGAVRAHLEFLPVTESNVIAYRLKAHAGGDDWEEIIVALNARPAPYRLTVPEGKYTVVCKDGLVQENGMGTLYGTEIFVPAQSAMILYK